MLKESKAQSMTLTMTIFLIVLDAGLVAILIGLAARSVSQTLGTYCFVVAGVLLAIGGIGGLMHQMFN